MDPAGQICIVQGSIASVFQGSLYCFLDSKQRYMIYCIFVFVLLVYQCYWTSRKERTPNYMLLFSYNNIDATNISDFSFCGAIFICLWLPIFSFYQLLAMLVETLYRPLFSYVMLVHLGVHLHWFRLSWCEISGTTYLVLIL